jgi:1-aminocyclopropane-1-carboxylate deaminase
MKSDQFPFNLPSPLQKLPMEGMDLWMKRDDLIHPIISGNKWRKLKGFFKKIDPSKTIITFGGAYSNHLPAAALAAKLHEMKIIGLVRGEELNKDSNNVLKYCASKGMELCFISRSHYRTLRERNWQMGDNLIQNIPNHHIVLPEGGAGNHTKEGCAKIWEEIKNEFIPDHLIISSGTGATVLGILSAMSQNEKTRVHVISAVRGAIEEMNSVCTYAEAKGIAVNWVNESFGGFGKTTPELLEESEKFLAQTGIQLDRNYNAKLWFWLKNHPPQGKVVWINTGGF